MKMCSLQIILPNIIIKVIFIVLFKIFVFKTSIQKKSNNFPQQLINSLTNKTIRQTQPFIPRNWLLFGGL